MATARRVPLTEIVEDLSEIVTRIVWSVVSTVDTAGRPRSRVMHPVWEIRPDLVEGVVATRPTPVKSAHLEARPFVTCAYWSPDHDAAFLDCHVRWEREVAARKAAWDRIAATPPPVGYDPAPLWPGGPAGDDFAALTLRPYRIQVVRGAALAKGEPTTMWTA